MKIGIVTEGEDLQSYVAEDFGRAPFFLIVDSETMDYQVVVNEHQDAAEGVGMLVAKSIASLGLDAVIVGGIGHHGYDILTKAGLKVSFDEEGSAEEALGNFLRRLEFQSKFQ